MRFFANQIGFSANLRKIMLIEKAIATSLSTYFEEQFYQSKPKQEVEQAQQKIVQTADVDQELLLKLLAKPEMAMLLKLLAKNL